VGCSKEAVLNSPKAVSGFVSGHPGQRLEKDHAEKVKFNERKDKEDTECLLLFHIHFCTCNLYWIIIYRHVETEQQQQQIKT
jgi:hypothetical protein